jgi:mono/diheme cytochrome c family protein
MQSKAGPIGVIGAAALVFLAAPGLSTIAHAAEPQGKTALQVANGAPAAETKAPALDEDAARKAALAIAEEPFDPEHPYVVTPEGLVDKRTQMGYKRYHMVCHVCHGPAGKGSSFAPALINSLKVLSYEDFITTVSNGRAKLSASQTVVMPSFATDPNVMNYLDEIYAYLKARSDGKLGEGRPFRVGEKRFFN